MDLAVDRALLAAVAVDALTRVRAISSTAPANFSTEAAKLLSSCLSAFISESVVIGCNPLGTSPQTERRGEATPTRVFRGVSAPIHFVVGLGKWLSRWFECRTHKHPGGPGREDSDSSSQVRQPGMHRGACANSGRLRTVRYVKAERDCPVVHLSSIPLVFV
jgi:hypothetical protein